MAEYAEEVDFPDPPRISTGASGLDTILGGGLDENRLYLCEGRPGTGKTALHCFYAKSLPRTTR